MSKRARAAAISIPIETFLLDAEEQHAGSRSWFVYLFALSDCSAFKVGFSCNPLQRICTFSRRYFERFDLSQSSLLPVHRCELARALEAALKIEFASQQTDAPIWVPAEAGGHTEWFSAVYFDDAETRLRALTATHEHAGEHAKNAFDLFRTELERVRASFEPWALTEVQRLADGWSFAQRGYAVRDQSTALRDWLDAYRYFDLPLFVDEPEIMEFVRHSVRPASGPR